MYAQKRGDKYRFYETYIDPRNNLRKTVSVTMDRDTRKSRKLAQERLNARILELTREPGKNTPMRLKDLCAAYMTYQRSRVTPQTVQGDEFALKAVLDILGEDTDINKIDARYVIERLDLTGESPTRKNYRIKHIKKLFRWAYLYNYVNANITDKLTRYKDNEKSRREYKYLEADELRKVIDAMTIDRYKVLSEFLALSGLRIGEALSLTQDDIDMDNRTITVNKTLSLVTGEIGQTKTDNSNRTIRIQTELLPLMDKVLPDCFKDIQYPAYCKYLKTITRKLGHEITPHALRHTHVSLLAGCGVPLDVISRRCGHKDSKITTDIYLHVTSLMVDRDAAILDAVRIM